MEKHLILHTESVDLKYVKLCYGFFEWNKREEEFLNYCKNLQASLTCDVDFVKIEI